jgi:hypothetical protein
MKKPIFNFVACLAVVGACTGYTSAYAAPVETDTPLASGTFTIDTTHDLILNSTATASAGDFGDQGGSLANLTDGSFGTAAGDPSASPSASQVSAAGGPGNGTSATYSLGTNATGYNLTDLQMYSGWTDSGRYQQVYTVEYSLASDPTTFFTLASVDYPPSADVGSYTAAETELTSASGFLLSNVADIQINFGDTSPFDWSGYRELVVDGTAASAAIPEPSTYALFLVGGLAVLATRFRRLSA